MSQRDLSELRERAIHKLGEVSSAAMEASDVETALRFVTRGVFSLLGDRTAHLKPASLKDGERQFFVSGIFLISPKQDVHILIAENGFPPEQHRLVIPIAMGHPGWMFRNRIPLILANTDEDKEFKQILQTARMGSVVMAPLMRREKAHGLLMMAAQARNTFCQDDLDILVAFAGLAVSVYFAHGGPDLLATLPTKPHDIPTVRD